MYYIQYSLIFFFNFVCFDNKHPPPSNKRHLV